MDLSYDGGRGLKVPPPLFLFVKTTEKVIRLCTALNFFLSGGCEDRDILWAFFTNWGDIGILIYLRLVFKSRTAVTCSEVPSTTS